MRFMRYRKRSSFLKSNIAAILDLESPNMASKYAVFKNGFVFVSDGRVHLRQTLTTHGLGLSKDILEGKALLLSDLASLKGAKGGYTVWSWRILKHLSKSKAGVAHILEVPLINIPDNYPPVWEKFETVLSAKMFRENTNALTPFVFLEKAEKALVFDVFDIPTKDLSTAYSPRTGLTVLQTVCTPHTIQAILIEPVAH